VIGAGLGLLLLALPASPPARQALAEGDTHYARRAEGARGGTADLAPIDAAIADYRRAQALDPAAYEPPARLLRALFFRGGFCGLAGRQQIQVFEQAKQLADQTVRRLDADVGRVRGRVRPDSARRVAPAAEIYLWAAIAWGQWSMDHKVAAAWQGAASKVRDMATASLEIDPGTEQGGAHLLLGRLHAEAPRIPMLTMWIARAKAVAHLRAGLALASDNRACQYFLADALLRFAAPAREEAQALLRRCATRAARPDYAVEDAHYAELARGRLATLR
jgi:hypothetical protein